MWCCVVWLMLFWGDFHLVLSKSYTSKQQRSRVHQLCLRTMCSLALAVRPRILSCVVIVSAFWKLGSVILVRNSILWFERSHTNTQTCTSHRTFSFLSCVLFLLLLLSLISFDILKAISESPPGYFWPELGHSLRSGNTGKLWDWHC